MRPYNTTAEWTPLAACKIPLRIQDRNSRLLSFRRCTSLLPFSFSLHVSDFTQTPIMERKTLKIPKRNLISAGDRSFSFIAPTVWNSLPIGLRNLPNPLWLQSQAQNFPFLTGIFTNLGGPWCVCVCVCICVCVCVGGGGRKSFIFSWMVCASALSFLDGKNCAMQEPSNIIIIRGHWAPTDEGDGP